MKRTDIKKLLGFLDRGSVSDGDWQTFGDPGEAKNAWNDLQIIKKQAIYSEPGFGPYFKRKVMSEVYAISRNTLTQTLDEVLSRLFSKVMVAGTITIILMLLAMFAFNGHVDLASLTGTDPEGETTFISTAFNEY